MTADLCIAGGGMAGVCAALAAARHGARVVLLQDRSVLGGNASSEIRMHMVGASCSGRRPGARESGLIEEIRLEDAVRNPDRSPALFDLLLYDLVRREPNITLLLDTVCTACEVEDGFIRRVRAVRHSTEDEFWIEARFFADCTGDSRLGREAGAGFRMGREARAEFGEPDAPEIADARTLGSTILFMAKETGAPVPFTAPPWARRFTDEQLKLRSHREFEYGYWWMEWGGQLDTIKDGDRIRHELLAIALGVWDHVKNHCTQPPDPSAAYEKWMDGATPEARGAERWRLDWVGMLPGKRESRRLLGPVILTEHDILGARLWPDTVAYGGWWIDLHPPAGVDAAAEYPCRQIETPHLYGIPLRALYSRNIANLFMAGRNISATHLAFASTRVMATCAVIGQAVGTAAALAAREGVSRADQAPVHEVQQALLRDDAFLPGVAVDDPLDLARGAAPAILTNGLTRRLTPALHPSFTAADNVWAGDTLTLRWDEPQLIEEVHLTFDTGFERELTLSMSDAFTRRMIRGPQPETVRDYEIEAGGQRLTVTSNYLRKRTHRFTRPAATRELAIRLGPPARLYELRVYGGCKVKERDA